jgi:hypothetical protein
MHGLPLPSRRTEALHTAVSDFVCSQCGLTGRVHVATRGVIGNNIVLILAGKLQEAAQKQAEKNSREKKALLVCPRCGHRDRRAYAWLLTKSATVGLVIGLIGCIPGLMLPVMCGWPLWVGAVIGMLAVAAPATAIVYIRSLKEMRTGVRFEEPEEGDQSPP